MAGVHKLTRGKAGISSNNNRNTLRRRRRRRRKNQKRIVKHDTENSPSKNWNLHAE
jgi:PBP1b-binding outer membrane lipoprotein LpoB